MKKREKAREAVEILEKYRSGDLHKAFMRERAARAKVLSDKLTQIKMAEEKEKKLHKKYGVIIQKKDEEIQKKDKVIQEKDVEIQKKDEEIKEIFEKTLVKIGYKNFCNDKMKFSKKLKKMQMEYDKEKKSFDDRVERFLFTKKIKENSSEIEKEKRKNQIKKFVNSIKNVKIEDCVDSDSETDE